MVGFNATMRPYRLMVVITIALSWMAASGSAQDAGTSASTTGTEAATKQAPDDDARKAADDPPKPSGEARLPGILVIGRRGDEPVPEPPLNAIGSRSVLTPEEVKLTGARDLNDLVQHLPGISTRPYNGGEAAAPSFSMRGLPDDGLTEYVHVLIDGTPANPLPYGWTAFSFMPITTERIHAVDYIRGGHAVRYSPNTVGGVLNFVTLPIPVEPRIESRTTFGNFGYVSNLVSIGGTTDDGLGAQFTYVDRRGDGYRDDGGFDQQDFNARVRLDFDSGAWLAGSAGYMRDEHRAPGGLTQAQFNQDRFGNGRPEGYFEGDRAVVDAVYHAPLGDDGFFEAFGYYSRGRRNLVGRRPRFGMPTTISDWEDVAHYAAAGVRVEQTVDIAGCEHRLYGGVRIHREWLPSYRIDSTPFGGGGPATRLQDQDFVLATYAAHIDDTFTIADAVTFTLGARMEWIPHARGEDDVSGFRYTDDYFRILPGAGVAWTFLPQWALFGNYMEGFRAPQVWGFAYTAPGADLDFERGRNGEVGIRCRDVAGFSGEITAWRVDFDEYTTFGANGNYDNLGRIVSVGTDVVLEFAVGDVIPALEGLTLSSSLTLQDAELRNGADRGNDVPYAWEHKATWRARYERDDWAFSLGGVKVGSSYSDPANTRATSADGQVGRNDGWTIWDARAARRFAIGERGALELAVGATNLFDREWEVHSRGGFFGGGLVAGSPRQYYASVGLSVDL